jgi:hypothetical protein
MHVRRFFLQISLLWAMTGFVNASVALWLQFSQSISTFVLAKSLISPAITVTAIAISVVWFKRSMTRHGVLAARAIPARVGVSA